MEKRTARQIRRRNGISPVQQSVLLAISHYFYANRRSPSLSDLAIALDVTSNAIFQTTTILVEFGLLQKTMNSHRSLRLTPKGRATVRQIRGAK